MRRLIRVRLLLLAVVFLTAAGSASAQTSSKPSSDLTLERCDRLPVVVAQAGDLRIRLLVDTAATTILNLKSFASGKSKDIQVSSWTGTAHTSAREILLPRLVIGAHRLQNLKLPAIDLTPIEKACRGKIDGILGIDLLEEMGATLEFERSVARMRLPGATPTEAEMIREEQEFDRNCAQAFNNADEATIASCFDEHIVLFTPWGEFRGKKGAVEYLRKSFFSVRPLPRFEYELLDHRVLGDAVWCNYKYLIALPNRVVEGRGSAIARKLGGSWQIISIHNSTREPGTLEKELSPPE